GPPPARRTVSARSASGHLVEYADGGLSSVTSRIARAALSARREAGGFTNCAAGTPTTREPSGGPRGVLPRGAGAVLADPRARRADELRKAVARDGAAGRDEQFPGPHLGDRRANLLADLRRRRVREAVVVDTPHQGSRRDPAHEGHRRPGLP